MALEFIPALIEAGKTVASIAGASSASKKAKNIASDYSEHATRFFSVLDVNLSLPAYSKYLDSADKEYLYQQAQNLAQELNSNPYAFDGESAFTSRYDDQYKGAVISNHNVRIKRLIEDYIDDKTRDQKINLSDPASGSSTASSISSALDRLRGYVTELTTSGQRVRQINEIPDIKVSQSINYTPYIIGGAAILAILILWRRK